MCAGLDVNPGSKTVQRERTTVHEKYGQQKKRTCSKLSAVVAMANFQQKEQSKSLKISKRKALAKL